MGILPVFIHGVSGMGGYAFWSFSLVGEWGGLCGGG